MPEQLPIICSGCGYELGDPKEEIKDPENDLDPDDPHFEIIRGGKGERQKCLEAGQFARPVGPDDDDYNDVLRKYNKDELVQEQPTGGPPDPQPKNEQKSQGGGQSRSSSPSDEVFDMEEEKNQMQLLAEVVSNPHYELEDGQIQEVKAWAEDYSGQMPPDVLEDLLGNMSGVSKQKAQLMRRRYELKLNKWIQDQHNNDSGPPIGIPGPNMGMRGGGSNGRGGGTRNQPTSPTPNGDTSGEEPKSDDHDPDGSRREDRSVGGAGYSDLRKERRARRVNRRNDAADIAAEEMAKEVAPEVARELTQNFGQLFGLPGTILQAKAERDPDWFLEKADEIEEKLGIDIFEEFLESSDAKKQQDNQPPQTGRSQPAVDDELDQVRNQIDQTEPTSESDDPPPEPTETEPMKTKSTNSTEEDTASGMQSMIEQSESELEETSEDSSDDDGTYDDIFGDEEPMEAK